MPNADDIRRLRAIAKRYRAKHVILAEWAKGSRQNFHKLCKNAADPKTAWIEVDPGMIFC
jgi:hypothetical protein